MFNSATVPVSESTMPNAFCSYSEIGYPLFVTLDSAHSCNSFYEVTAAKKNVLGNTQFTLRDLRTGDVLPGTYSSKDTSPIDFEFGFADNIPIVGRAFIFRQVKFKYGTPAIEKLTTSNVQNVLELSKRSKFSTYAVTTEHSLYLVQVYN